MLLNGVHEQCPNTDPKQCTVTKLGWVHSAHNQNQGRAHIAGAVPRSWALLRVWLTGRAHGRLVARTASAGRALAKRALVAKRLGSLPHVATSLRCRDIKATKIMSRHQIGVATPLRPLQVATSKRGRDTVSPAQPQAR